ncbi:MAG: RNA 2',3'-cyclic phosphodiesterase [Nitrosomonadales bacterium]|nr:RNA 2',3'-cyclic phosphodiesterase [Nitrosomonadales bacterium]
MSRSDQARSARMFFALWPDDAERAALAALQPGLHELCGGHAMRADTLHATLVFMGEVAPQRLESLQLAAQEVAGESFELTFDMMRYWGHNHIVYAAPRIVPPQLAQLVGDLKQCLDKHRFRIDNHPYKPHVTLLRHAKWSDTPLPEMPRTIWQCRSFALMQSLLDAQGARYREWVRFPLAV